MNRRHFLFGLAALLTCQCFGQVLPSARRAVSVVAVTSCATTDTAIPHDTLLEGFQTATTGYEQTWTPVASGNSTINPAADSSSLTTGKPEGACDQAFNVAMGNDGTETYVRWNNGSPIDLDSTAVTITFYIVVASGTLDTHNDLVTVASIGASTNPTIYTAGVSLINDGGAIKIYAGGNGNSAKITITAGAWTRVDLYIDTAIAGSTSLMAARSILIGLPTGIFSTFRLGFQ